nr:hypothetical protein [Pseudomonas putida]
MTPSLLMRAIYHHQQEARKPVPFHRPESRNPAEAGLLGWSVDQLVELFFANARLKTHVLNQVTVKRGFGLVHRHLSEGISLPHPLLMTPFLVSEAESKLLQD